MWRGSVQQLFRPAAARVGKDMQPLVAGALLLPALPLPPLVPFGCSRWTTATTKSGR